MARFNMANKKKAGKGILIGGIAAIALTGAIAGGVALKKVNGQITTATLSTSAYTIGTLRSRKKDDTAVGRVAGAADSTGFSCAGVDARAQKSAARCAAKGKKK